MQAPVAEAAAAPPPRPPEAGHWFVRMVAAGALGTLGGVLFLLLHLPLPWTLGALSVAAVASGLGFRRVLMPRPVRDVLRPVLGVFAGSAFTPAVVAGIGDWWPGILFSLGFSLTVTATGWVYFRKVCGYDPVTAYFSSTPGGLGELTLLGASLGGHMRKLVLVHSVRIVAVVFSLPWILQLVLGHAFVRQAVLKTNAGGVTLEDALLLSGCGVLGYVIGKHTAFPGGIMIASMLVSAAVHAAGLTAATPPGWMVVVLQIVVGSVAGARFLGVTWSELRGTVFWSLLWAALLIALALGAAALASTVMPQGMPSLLLAASPGGTAEVTVISVSLGLETAFILTCQVCRSFFILAIAPALFRLLGPGAGSGGRAE